MTGRYSPRRESDHHDNEECRYAKEIKSAHRVAGAGTVLAATNAHASRATVASTTRTGVPGPSLAPPSETTAP